MQFAENTKLLIAVTDVVDAANNPTTLKSVPTWTTSDDSILSLTVAADGLSATGTVAKTGVVTVTATAGADDGGISASVAITGIAGAAVSFQLTVTPQ